MRSEKAMKKILIWKLASSLSGFLSKNNDVPNPNIKMSGINISSSGFLYIRTGPRMTIEKECDKKENFSVFHKKSSQQNNSFFHNGKKLSSTFYSRRSS